MTLRETLNNQNGYYLLVFITKLYNIETLQPKIELQRYVSVLYLFLDCYVFTFFLQFLDKQITLYFNHYKFLIFQKFSCQN